MSAITCTQPAESVLYGRKSRVPINSSHSRARYTAAEHDDYVTRFYKLLHQWRAQTMWSSSAKEKMEHHAFKKIVSMGDVAVPLIIKEIKTKRDFIFLALHAITGENPVQNNSKGNISRIIDDWLLWWERTRSSYAAV